MGQRAKLYKNFQEEIHTMITASHNKSDPYMEFTNKLDWRYDTVINSTNALVGSHDFNDQQFKRMEEVLHQNFIINIVTCVETFLKDVIIDRKGRWDNEGLNNLLNQDISLKDAVNLSKVTSLTREAVLAYTSSFQNIDHIKKVFNPLLKFDNNKYDVFRGIETRLKRQYKNYTNMFDEHLNTFERTFKIRHLLVHSNQTIDLKTLDLNGLKFSAELLMFCLDMEVRSIVELRPVKANSGG